ncbi:hypothetical protein E2C01_033194 [Portunus trituberculatus]|uniref:Uncharacterized protein n=1 Tax=Portunus trituberculatus TaxID=210409 RepID=A0A5B7F345_PORTR|nr:hypothetical protein [Portunus trituberculatus]
MCNSPRLSAGHPASLPHYGASSELIDRSSEGVSTAPWQVYECLHSNTAPPRRVSTTTTGSVLLPCTAPRHCWSIGVNGLAELVTVFLLRECPSCGAGVCFTLCSVFRNVLHYTLPSLGTNACQPPEAAPVTCRRQGRPMKRKHAESQPTDSLAAGPVRLVPMNSRTRAGCPGGPRSRACKRWTGMN